MSPACPDPGAPGAQRLPRSARIRRGSEIRKLFRRGKRRRTSHLDVFLLASPVACSRLGLVVARHGHDIVERNTLKRRLREIGRREVLPGLRAADAGLDVLIRARPGAYGAGFDALRRELVELTRDLTTGRD